jgi:hypothetical protein
MALHSGIEAAVDETEAARILGCTVACLRAWRQRKYGPTFIRVGRLVRYRPSELADFMDRNRVSAEDAGQFQGRQTTRSKYEQHTTARADHD